MTDKSLELLAKKPFQASNLLLAFSDNGRGLIQLDRWAATSTCRTRQNSKQPSLGFIWEPYLIWLDANTSSISLWIHVALETLNVVRKLCDRYSSALVSPVQ